MVCPPPSPQNVTVWWWFLKICTLLTPLSFRRCSRQHCFWPRAGGPAYSHSWPKPATAAPVRTGNIGARKSVPVSPNIFLAGGSIAHVCTTLPIIHISFVFLFWGAPLSLWLPAKTISPTPHSSFPVHPLDQRMNTVSFFNIFSF